MPTNVYKIHICIYIYIYICTLFICEGSWFHTDHLAETNWIHIVGIINWLFDSNCSHN